ncbi:hypothetical protein R1sor_002751 [Riccia sorocarpa]|uniref:Endonuclease/exonuclease/phosphatase domain-containing protein n=1 Tax=Riccia sorocarpa TaxID=122646 RepID=A0ABD3H3L3_9MARC
MTGEEPLKMASWNVNGLGGGDRVRAVRHWLDTEGKDTKVLALQELKTQEATAEFNLRQLMANNRGCWFLLGDWNMTLMREDSSGPTPLLKGSPMDAWRETKLAWSLTDAYAIARRRTGPRYTRQVVRGRRLDQSRLDRVYLSNNASW